MSDKFYNCKVRGCDKSYIYFSFFWKYMKVYGNIFLSMEEKDFDDSYFDGEVFFFSSLLLKFFYILILINIIGIGSL